MKTSRPSSSHEPSFLRLNAGSSRRPEADLRLPPPTPRTDAAPETRREAASPFKWLAVVREPVGKARQFIRAGFVTALFLLALVSVLAVKNTTRLLQVEAQVARSFELRDQINALQTAQMRTRAALREHLLSARPSEKVAFEQQVSKLKEAAAGLRQKAGDASSRAASALVIKEAAAMQAADAARKTRPASLPLEQVLRYLHAGMVENEAAGKILDRMDKREAVLLAARQAAAQKIAKQTFYAAGLGGAFALLVVCFAFLVVERDLTRRSRIETILREREGETDLLVQKLRESEERFRVVADTAPVMLYATDDVGAATYLSRPWLEFTGRPEEKELGFGWAEGIPEKERSGIIEATREARKNRVPVRTEYRLRRHDGALRWLLAASVPRFLDGQYAGHIGSAVDITEIKQAQEEMRALIERQQKSEGRLRQVSRQANCLLWEAQVDETVAASLPSRSWTPAWFNREKNTTLHWELAILDEAEAHRWLPVAWQAGQPFAEAFEQARYPEDRAVLDQTGSSALRENKTGFKNEFRCRLADGSDRWLAEDVRIERLNPSDGGETADDGPALGRWRLVGVCTDITDRKRQEEKLTRLTIELQRSNEALQDFASIASHDLREPLRKIQMFGGMLQKHVGQSDDATAERNLERVLAAASRMDLLVRDLLLYSRVTSKAAPLALIDLDKIVSEVIVDLEARILETGGTVGHDNLPRFRADALQMRQLFQNLISNALKFHKPGDMPLVLVRGKRELINGELFVVVSVSDNGIGFEPEYAERVFNIFERLDRARDGYEGTGVGLAICRKIAQRHGGSVTAQSQPGFGSTFTVRLPVLPEAGAGGSENGG